MAAGLREETLQHVYSGHTAVVAAAYNIQTTRHQEGYRQSITSKISRIVTKSTLFVPFYIHLIGINPRLEARL